MLPIVVEASASESWLDSVIRFSQELRSRFGKRLLRVIALPSPDQEVHDSNVLVVLDRYDLSDVDAIVELASRTDERINPLVASADEEDEVEAFLQAFLRERWTEGSLEAYFRELRSRFGKRLLRVIALPSPDQEVHDSNVLVVLDRYDLSDVDAIVELASRTDERINPLVASADEEDEVEAFLQAGGRDVQADQV